MSFLTEPVNFRKAVSAWFATFLICGGLYWLLRPLVGEVSPWALPNIYVYIPFTLFALASPVPSLTVGFDSLDSLAAWTAIGVTLASLVVLLLACRRGLPRWKVMGASMLVWVFGPAFAANPRGFYAFLFAGVISYPFDVVLALVLVIGLDKLFDKVSRR